MIAFYGLQTPSSSSSSSPSGVTTPADEADEVSPVLVTFPRRPDSMATSSSGLASSGSSSLSLYLLNQKLTSSRPSRFTRRPKLSLDTSKPSPIPALSSATIEHSPLGAFSPTSSAESHLRSLANRACGDVDTQFTAAIERVSLASPKRQRALSLRSAFSWVSSSPTTASFDDVDSDSYNSSKSNNVPAISRSPSSSISLPAPPPLIARHTSPLFPGPSAAPAKSTRPPHMSHTRSGSTPPAAASDRPTHVRRSSNLSLDPRSALRREPRAGQPASAIGPKGLNPALAAVERQI